jgi:hypothetical protein
MRLFDIAGAFARNVALLVYGRRRGRVDVDNGQGEAEDKRYDDIRNVGEEMRN